jgi:hypothetical protein
MPTITRDLFPGGKRKAVTMSYDDGTVHDRKMVEIFNRHGVKGTFHLNSGTLGKEGMLTREEIGVLFKGHEISAHSVTHPHLGVLTPAQMAQEILDDRCALEALAGYPVRGMSYPFGSFTQAVVDALPAYGIEYSRTVLSHGTYHLPEDPLRWHPTCGHSDKLLERTASFVKGNSHGNPWLLYVWGHSEGFSRSGWDLLEQFCALVAGASDSIWCATNIEIIDYRQAMRQLRVSVNGDMVQNLSGLTVWFSVDGKPRQVAPGELLRIA